MEHYWQNLAGQNWFSGAGVYRSQVRRAGQRATFVELGCWKGRSTAFMGVEIVNSRKAIEFWAVDHWKGSDEKAQHDDEDVAAGRLFDVFKANIEPVKHVVNILECDSAEAATHFGDASVDFVYVDASHTYEAVKRELQAWWPKLKPGAVLAGDDWLMQEPSGAWGIQQAVNEFAREHLLRFEVFPGEPNKYWPQWQLVRSWQVRGGD